MVCAGQPEGKKDSCGGDSGGPLIVKGIDETDLVALGAERSSDSSTAILYGVVSFGPKNCGIAKVTGVYTRVTEYIQWILSHMKGKNQGCLLGLILTDVDIKKVTTCELTLAL